MRHTTYCFAGLIRLGREKPFPIAPFTSARSNSADNASFPNYAKNLVALTASATNAKISFNASSGTSTGGAFSVSGTIGQPDAGKMSGGSFTVDGGFWGIIAAVQTPGAPLLTITLNSQPSTITLSWPSPSTGFDLQQNTNSVSSVNWSNVVTTPSDDGTNKFIVVNPPTGNRFYRLFKP